VEGIKEAVSLQDLPRFLDILHRRDASRLLGPAHRRLGAFVVALDIPSEQWVQGSMRVFGGSRGAQPVSSVLLMTVTETSVISG
jgi:hypothetical protein